MHACSVMSDSATPWTGSASLLYLWNSQQARVLEWVAISSSRGSSPPRDPTHISCIGRQILY